MPYGPTDFWLIVVKPYYTNELSHDITITVKPRAEDEESTIIVQPDTTNDTEQATEPVKKRPRGRPRKNASTSAAYITAKE